MTRVDGFSSHRWIIFFHVAFMVQSKVNAQSGQAPSPKTSAFAALFTVFFLIGLLSVYIRHCSRSNPGFSTRHYHRHRRAYDDSSRRDGLDDAVVESFPVFFYSSVKQSKIGSGDLECAICLNEIEDRETVRLLPICNHLFHIDCIDAWLYSHATCPVCRSDLTAKCEENDTETRSPIRDQVAIDISTEDSEKSHHRVRLGFEITGKFPRSNSTGHSIGRFSDSTERFTLRLPDDVRRRIMAAKGRRLKRARSFDGVLTAEGRGEESSYTVGSGEKSDRVNWVDRLGLFVTKSNSGSVISQKSNGEPLK